MDHGETYLLGSHLESLPSYIELFALQSRVYFRAAGVERSSDLVLDTAHVGEGTAQRKTGGSRWEPVEFLECLFAKAGALDGIVVYLQQSEDSRDSDMTVVGSVTWAVPGSVVGSLSSACHALAMIDWTCAKDETRREKQVRS